MEQDLSWKQRYAYYQKALRLLSQFIEKGKLNKLGKLELTQVFELFQLGCFSTLKMKKIL